MRKFTYFVVEMSLDCIHLHLMSSKNMANIYIALLHNLMWNFKLKYLPRKFIQNVSMKTENKFQKLHEF